MHGSNEPTNWSKEDVQRKIRELQRVYQKLKQEESDSQRKHKDYIRKSSLSRGNRLTTDSYISSVSKASSSKYLPSRREKTKTPLERAQEQLMLRQGNNRDISTLEEEKDEPTSQ